MGNVERNILLSPGPATTTDSVKRAMVVPDVCPREEEFKGLMKGIRRDLLNVVNGNEKDQTAVVFGGSGTAVIEATLCSVIAPGKKVVILINGAYGERMCEITNAHGIPTIRAEVGWGMSFDWDSVEAVIKKENNIGFLALVHHETTTGILNNLEMATILAKKYGLATVVDAVSSYAGIPIDIKRTPTDFLISTSNKCIQGMPGVAFVICQKRALSEAKDASPGSLYLNLYDQYDFMERTGEMRFTPPVQVFYALRQALDEYFKEGANRRWTRYKRSHRVLVEGLRKLGFRLYLDEDVETSQILTAVWEPNDPNYSFSEFHDRLYERGFTIYPGKLADEDTFRLSILGAIDHHDIRNFLVALREVLDEMKISLDTDYA